MKLNNLILKTLGVFAAAGFAFATTSCEKGGSETPAPPKEVEKAVEKAGDAVKDAAQKTGDAVKEAAKDAGDAAKKAVNETAKKVEKATK